MTNAPEVFYIGHSDLHRWIGRVIYAGYYWVPSFSYLLDGDPVGPFSSKDEALANATATL